MNIFLLEFKELVVAGLFSSLVLRSAINKVQKAETRLCRNQ